MSNDDIVNTGTLSAGVTFQLASGPVASAFAEREIVPALAELMDKGSVMQLTNGQFIDALVNVQAEYLAAILGNKAAGGLLQDLGRHLIERDGAA
ncbi:MAG: hypothetical protein VR70_06725 [Rhodospirillaceae bacterium BRH_c57]|nr:MAG: hypothetical protein VR70_06725 [Rhodospirillaceae bacterium BRH_c57]